MATRESAQGGGFTFNLTAVDLCPRPGVDNSLETSPLPPDFADVVARRNDHFRDDFTRLCLYLAQRYIVGGASPDRSTVIVGTEYGDLVSMLRLQRQAMANDASVAAQQFPYATTSSAATFVNIVAGVTGGNVTVNAGRLTAAVALLQAMLHVTAVAGGTSHLLIGDAYCAEARDDIAKAPDNFNSITSSVVYARIASGETYAAEFVFRPVDRTSPFGTQDDHRDRNGGVAAYWLLRSAQSLDPGEQSELALAHGDREARVTIVKSGTGESSAWPAAADRVDPSTAEPRTGP